MSEVLELQSAAACANCAAPLNGKYCSACGQKIAPHNPTLTYFLHELAHELLHFDGKIFRSVRLLVTRPGFLTNEILAGRRASYVSPIRLYLVFSILAFALGAARLAELNVEYTPSPGETVDPQVQVEMEQIATAASAAVSEWLPCAMFVLVPLFAALVMLVRRSSGLNYPQHLYFALHVQAFHFLLRAFDSAVVALDAARSVQTATYLLTTVGSIAYFFAAFRNVYGTTLWGTLWRCGVVVAIYFVALIAAVASIAFPLVFGSGGGTP